MVILMNIRYGSLIFMCIVLGHVPAVLQMLSNCFPVLFFTWFLLIVLTRTNFTTHTTSSQMSCHQSRIGHVFFCDTCSTLDIIIILLTLMHTSNQGRWVAKPNQGGATAPKEPWPLKSAPGKYFNYVSQTNDFIYKTFSFLFHEKERYCFLDI